MKKAMVNFFSSMITALVLILFALPGFAETAEPVKMSVNGICHAPGTQYYSRTKLYTEFDTVEECIAAGGRAPR